MHSLFFLARCGALAAAAAALAPAMAQAPAAVVTFPPAEIAAGAKLYESHCAACHGPKMADTGGGFFDLRKFPPGQRSRFVNSVANGKNNMPPWKSLLSQEQIGHLFAYVVAGEKSVVAGEKK